MEAVLHRRREEARLGRDLMLRQQRGKGPTATASYIRGIGQSNTPHYTWEADVILALWPTILSAVLAVLGDLISTNSARTEGIEAGRDLTLGWCQLAPRLMTSTF